MGKWINRLLNMLIMEYYSSIKGTNLLHAPIQMHLKSTMLNERNLSQKDRLHVISLIWNYRKVTYNLRDRNQQISV